MGALARILVTGGAGFVGSNLVDALLHDGHAVTVIDDLSSGKRENLSPGARFVQGDVRDADLMHRLVAESDACFHLAAIASVQRCNENWPDSHSVNQSAFVGLLDHVARRPGGVIPVVYASSAAVYGDTDAAPIDQTRPLKPLSIYGADKAGCERAALAAGRSMQVASFGLRPFNIYGPRQDPHSPYSGVISIFAERLRRDEALTVFGDGGQTRDFIHVDDIVALLRAALPQAATAAPVCDAATGRATSVLDLARIIGELMGCTPKITFAPARDGDIRHSLGDPTRATGMLGVEPRIGLHDGLRFLLDSRGASS